MSFTEKGAQKAQSFSSGMDGQSLNISACAQKGDLRIAQKLSGLPLEDFREMLRKAGIPTTYF
jgi:cystathionine beta-lyase/cystathionine gamma-synthase